MKILILLCLVVVAVVLFFVFRPSQNPQRRIEFEIQVEEQDQAQEGFQLTLVNNDKVFAGMGPVQVKSLVKTETGVLIKTEPTLIHRDPGQHALVIKTLKPLAQVFELPQKAADTFEWSPWFEASHFEDSKTADWNFMDKKNQARVASDSTNFKIKIRFKSEAFNLREEFQQETARRQQMTNQEILRLRAELVSGKVENACQLVVLDPQASEQEFLICKVLIDEKKTTEEKWKWLSLFMGRSHGRAFVSWDNDKKLPGQTWSRRRNAVPKDHQIWFLQAFFETWLKLDEPTFFETMPNVRDSIGDMFRVQWTQDGFSYVRDDLPQMIQVRVKPDANDEAKWLFEAMADVDNKGE